MATSPIILILGSGPRVGASVAQTFASNGYKVAIASRKGTDSQTSEGYLSLKADLANSGSIGSLFESVKGKFGAAPSVVVYNAPALTMPTEQGNIFSISGESVAKDLTVNTVSAYVAAQEAVKGWTTLPSETKKTFIYTGNVLNEAVFPVPMMLNLGMGKAASAYWIGSVDMISSGSGKRYVHEPPTNEPSQGSS